ncbi:MAG: NAD-dependent epimerase/dehydratase family protein [Planctomycetota bacterium]
MESVYCKLFNEYSTVEAGGGLRPLAVAPARFSFSWRDAKRMRILVTGATGFLGNNLIRAILANGDEVVAAVRSSSDRDPLRGLDVEVVVVDFEKSADISFAINDVDAVVHAAAMIQLGWSKLEVSRQVNVGYTKRIAEAARRKNIRMIYVSSVDALGVGNADKLGDESKLDPPNPGCSYVVSKREAETEFLIEVANGLDGVIVNPGFMIGPNDWKPSSGEMMIFLQKSLIFFVPAGGCSVVDVRDVADGIISAIQHGRSGERYILAGENLTYKELWKQMASVMNSMPPRRRMSNLLASTVGKVGDFLSRFTKEELVVNSAATRMGQLYHWYSSDKAKQELGYQISSVEDAISDAYDWFCSMGYIKK